MNEKEIADFLREHVVLIRVTDKVNVVTDVPEAVRTHIMQVPFRKTCVNTFKPKKEKKS